MIPQLSVGAARICPVEQVIGPLGVTERIGFGRPDDARFAAIAELGLSTLTTPGTFD
jgi:hypothetical protein